MREITEEQFLREVANHKMTIQQDQGVFRHIRFAQPDTYNMSFNLTTWPNHLAISGDMGTFVFDRLADMFEFFRNKPYKDEKVPINPGYWAEKCEAQDTRSDGIRAYDPNYLREKVRETWEEHYEDRLESDEAKECWSELESFVLGSENLYEAHSALRDFEHEGFSFQDTWEWRLTSATPRYIWCLYAIAWGIQQYDAAKETSREIL